MSKRRSDTPGRVVGAVVWGTLLNPLNSAMIAVALVQIEREFRVGVAAASWLVSGFYLAAAVGQPLMGSFADRFGARRVFLGGLGLVCVTGGLAAAVPGFWLVVGLRVVMALGTSTGFPAGMALIRARFGGRHGAPQAALGAVAAANSTSAALGPVLGGFLVQAWGWRAIFLVNVPVTLVGLAVAGLWLPASHDAPSTARPDRQSDWEADHANPSPGRASSNPGPADSTADPARPAGTSRRPGRLGHVDPLGIALFSGSLICLLAFILSIPRGVSWPLLPAAVAGAVGFVAWELRAGAPFLDVRMLAANRPLLAVYGQYVAINVVFYAAFFGLPLWLEGSRGADPRLAGLMMLPMAGLSVVAVPIAGRVIDRAGVRVALVVGGLALLAGSAVLLGVGHATAIPLVVAAIALLGVPSAFNNLGLNTVLYERAPRAVLGTASGLFQTSRYLGSILSTAVIGVVFAVGTSDAGLHAIAAVMIALSAGVVVASALTGRSA